MTQLSNEKSINERLAFKHVQSFATGGASNEPSVKKRYATDVLPRKVLVALRHPKGFSAGVNVSVSAQLLSLKLLPQCGASVALPAGEEKYMLLQTDLMRESRTLAQTLAVAHTRKLGKVSSNSGTHTLQKTNFT